MKAGGPDGDRRHGPFLTVFLDRWRLLRFTRSVRPSPISPRISRSRGDGPLSARRDRISRAVVAGPAGTASIRPRGSRQTEMPSPVRQPYVQDGRHDRPHRRCPHELVPHVPGVTDDWESGSVAGRSALPRRTTPWPSGRTRGSDPVPRAWVPQSGRPLVPGRCGTRTRGRATARTGPWALKDP